MGLLVKLYKTKWPMGSNQVGHLIKLNKTKQHVWSKWSMVYNQVGHLIKLDKTKWHVWSKWLIKF
jgi:hypothetical protein